MKKIISNILIIGLMISMMGCSSTNNSELSITSESSVPSSISSSIENDEMVLSKKEMLEDYDTMWIAVKDNSPFLGIIERKYGSDYLNNTIQNYRQQIESMEMTGDYAMLEFIRIVAESMSEAVGLVDGHAGIENSDRFFENQTTYSILINSDPELKPWLDVLEKPEITSFDHYYDELIQRNYEYLTGGNSDQEEEIENEQEPEESNLTLKILEDNKIAYIKVNSFATELMEEDLPKIHSFLEEIGNYENLIIDIQDNGGGNATYWEEAFVRPNIVEPLETLDIRLMRNESLAKTFYGQSYEYSNITIEDITTNTNFNALQKGDIDKLDYAREISSTIQPLSNEKLFQGNVWVLTSPNVYSSAESFAQLCKKTQFATLVGETTGGGNTGGPVWFELPNSHMLVSFDVEYALNPDGSCTQKTGTVPDIESENALETVVNLINAQ